MKRSYPAGSEKIKKKEEDKNKPRQWWVEQIKQIKYSAN